MFYCIFFLSGIGFDDCCMELGILDSEVFFMVCVVCCFGWVYVELEDLLMLINDDEVVVVIVWLVSDFMVVNIMIYDECGS